MKCQQCDQQATYHITELSSGSPQEVHLCAACAQDYLSEPAQEPAGGLNNLASALAQKLAIGETAEELARLEQKSCPVCGITFLEFRKQGRLGCPHDYEHFQGELKPLIENIHGESEHVGKVPSSRPRDSARQTEMLRLRREMKEAVSREEYERASDIRDQIRRLEESP